MFHFHLFRPGLSRSQIEIKARGYGFTGRSFTFAKFSQCLPFIGGTDQGCSQLFDQLQAWLTFISTASFPVVLGDFGCDVNSQAGNSYIANWPGYEAGILGGRLREVRLYEKTLSGRLGELKNKRKVQLGNPKKSSRTLARDFHYNYKVLVTVQTGFHKGGGI